MAFGALVTQGTTGATRWEVAQRAPRPELAGVICDLQGYVERADAWVWRREFSALQVVVILEFEPRLRVYESGQERAFHHYSGGFVAGLDERYTLTAHAGYQAGVQLNLDPLGARRVFGLPMSELRGRAVTLSDVLPNERTLSEELASLCTWDARFDRVERFVRARLERAAPPDPVVRWAIERIAATSGRLSVDQLAAELGYSHKHVIARFRDQVGIPPKLWARLWRFQRLRAEAARGGPRTLAELAQACGYYDQAHLARDVRRFTGGTATQLLEAKGWFG